jgi:hypothetical protein
MQDREYCLLQAYRTRAMAVLAEPPLNARLLRMAKHWESMATRADLKDRPVPPISPPGS